MEKTYTVQLTSNELRTLHYCVLDELADVERDSLLPGLGGERATRENHLYKIREKLLDAIVAD